MSSPILPAIDNYTAIKDYVYARGEAELVKILPKAIDAERFLRVSLHALRTNPTLMQCTKISILQSLLEAARLGLEPTGAMGGAWLVPFRQKNGDVNAQLIVDYRGLIRLAMESGFVASIEAQLVREGEVFEVERGNNPTFRHVPELGNDGSVIGAYAIARFTHGGYQSEIMSTADIEAIRKRSKAANAGPWVSDWNEMARKTVVRRLCKYVPLGERVRRALQIEDDAEANSIEASGEIIHSRADAVRAKIQAAREQSGSLPAPLVDSSQEPPAEKEPELADVERGVGD